jgi:hypothetical protein
MRLQDSDLVLIASMMHQLIQELELSNSRVLHGGLVLPEKSNIRLHTELFIMILMVLLLEKVLDLGQHHTSNIMNKQVVYVMMHSGME